MDDFPPVMALLARIGIVLALVVIPAPAEAQVPKFRVCPVAKLSRIGDQFGADRLGSRVHQGVDLYAPYGSPVLAVESGRVENIYRAYRGGLVLRLRGASGTGYFNAHLSATSVRKGQHVTAGQQIGAVGTSGTARHPHLHFEVRPGGPGTRAVNPMRYVRTVCH